MRPPERGRGRGSHLISATRHAGSMPPQRGGGGKSILPRAAGGLISRMVFRVLLTHGHFRHTSRLSRPPGTVSEMRPTRCRAGEEGRPRPPGARPLLPSLRLRLKSRRPPGGPGKPLLHETRVRGSGRSAHVSPQRAACGLRLRRARDRGVWAQQRPRGPVAGVSSGREDPEVWGVALRGLETSPLPSARPRSPVPAPGVLNTVAERGRWASDVDLK